MNSSYPVCSLSDIADRIDYGLTASATDTSVGPKFLRITDIAAERLDWSTVPFCQVASDDERHKYALARGDIVIARTGATVGYSKYIVDDIDAVFASYLVRVRVGRECDSRYVGYVVGSTDYKDFIKSNAGGAAQPNANARVLTSYMVPFPPLDTQRKIAAILSAYDDLIENNNRRIKLLEEIAQRIYRKWFVDFRYPGHEDVPLVDSELGLIPDGWTGGSLREVVEHHIGGGWGADEIGISHDRLARVIRGTDIPRIRWGDVSSCPVRYHTAANLRSRLLHPGDIVFEVSGGSKGQPVGRSVLISDVVLNELGADAIAASFCKLVRADRDILLPELLSHRFVDAYASGELGAYQVQSTGITNLRFSQLLESFPVLIAPMALQSRFVNCVGSTMSVVNLLGIQNRNLRATRDLLLPRLISGEIDVADLHIAMPGVAA